MLNPEIAVVLIPTAPDLAQVSSTTLKERIQHGEDVSTFCPGTVAARLRSRLLHEDLGKEGVA